MVGVKELCEAISPRAWLGHRTQDRFHHLAASYPEPDADGSRAHFARRGLDASAFEIDERALARELVAVDLRVISHATSFLVSPASRTAARDLLSDALGTGLPEDPPRLDHVGLEVFGRLEWYVDVLEAWARQGALRLLDFRLFASVQVRRALAHDPALRNVRVARVYLESDGHPVNLELFEAEQHWLFTAARQVATFSDSPAAPVASLLGDAAAEPAPVAHLALAVSRHETLLAVERMLSEAAAGGSVTRAYADGISHNAADQSLNTKFRRRCEAPDGSQRLGPIIELIGYGLG